jgi:hypothetical protein
MCSHFRRARCTLRHLLRSIDVFACLYAHFQYRAASCVFEACCSNCGFYALHKRTGSSSTSPLYIAAPVFWCSSAARARRDVPRKPATSRVAEFTTEIARHWLLPAPASVAGRGLTQYRDPHDYRRPSPPWRRSARGQSRLGERRNQLDSLRLLRMTPSPTLDYPATTQVCPQATRILPGCYPDASGRLPRYFLDTTRILPGCYPDATRMLPECFPDATWMLPGRYLDSGLACNQALRTRSDPAQGMT